MKCLMLGLLLAAPLFGGERALFSNVTLLNEGGGNVILIDTPKGKIMVDSGTPDAAAVLTKKIPALAYLLTTHRHQDHTGGNVFYGRGGAKIIAHGNTAAYLGQMKFAKEGLPSETFTDTYKLSFGGEELQLIYLPNAHTDGDFIVHIPSKNYIHMADISFGDKFNYIDTAYGGTIDGLIAATGRVLALADAKTLITPGHGEPLAKKALEANLKVYQSVRDAVKAAKDGGKSLAEVQAQNPTAKFKGYAWGFVDGSKFTEFVYNSLK